MIDLEPLDEYLTSDDSPENCMMLSDLDGFLHGVACGPEFVPLDEWLPVALGADLDGLPEWVIQAVKDLYMKISSGLSQEPQTVEPIFWEAAEGHVIAMDWCEGFMDAVGLRPKEWLRLTESGTHGFLIAPMVTHLLDDDGNSMLGIPQEALDESLDNAAKDIPDAIAGIAQFWRNT